MSAREREAHRLRRAGFRPELPLSFRACLTAIGGREPIRRELIAWRARALCRLSAVTAQAQAWLRLAASQPASRSSFSRKARPYRSQKGPHHRGRHHPGLASEIIPEWWVASNAVSRYATVMHQRRTAKRSDLSACVSPRPRRTLLSPLPPKALAPVRVDRF